MICGDFQASAWLDLQRLHQSRLPDYVYGAVDLITPNETETEALVGIWPETAAAAARAAAQAVSRRETSGSGMWFFGQALDAGNRSTNTKPPPASASCGAMSEPPFPCGRGASYLLSHRAG